MLFRALAYIVLGWLLLAAVAALGKVFALSVMLPSTSAVLLVHLAFAREGTLPAKLGVVTVLGYLEDLHQGAPIGTLILAHQLAFLALHWAAGRLALRSWMSRAAAAAAAVALVDLSTYATLMLLAESMRVPREALHVGLWQARWHVLATFLAAHPTWLLTDWLFARLRLDQPRPSTQPAAREGE